MANNLDPQTTVKPANDAYTGMLAVSFTALLLGCIVLFMDYSQYPSKPPDKVNVTPRDRGSPAEWTAKPGAEKAPPDEIITPDAKDEPKDKDKDKDLPDIKKGGRR